MSRAEMPSFSSPSTMGARDSGRPTTLSRLCRRLVHKSLERLEHGEVEVVDPLGRVRFGSKTAALPLRAEIRVGGLDVYRRLARGTVEAARAYQDGAWEADDLVALVRIVARNRRANTGLDGGLSRLGTLVERLGHRLRPNSRSGSRANIGAHYDLGNDFFRLFLDRTMTYSCALFDTPETSLEAAQEAKLARICQRLDLAPQHELLEIGTGWGSLALYAATHYGCRVTTTTVSGEQMRLAEEKVAAAGVADRVTVLSTDYRDLPALGRRFDRLVSVEMIEAVGEAYLDLYLDCCARLLTPEGKGLLQAILVEDRIYGEYRRGADFIQRLVFPGSFLPCLSDLLARLARVSELSIVAVDDLTSDYALTLGHWRRRLQENRQRALELGYTVPFLRLWDYYLAYCQGGFLERVIRDVQITLAGPDWRPEHGPPRGECG